MTDGKHESDEPVEPGADAQQRRHLSVGPEALKAFAHPLRMALYSELGRRGSATASGLARALGESSGQTSYHLRQLERHGFVEDDPRRTGGRERWWRSVGFDMTDPQLLADPSTKPAAMAVLHQVIAERATALTAWANSSDPMREQVGLLSGATVELTPAEIEELSAQLQELVQARIRVARGRTAPPDAVRTRIYLDVVPLVEVEPPAR
ncbi:winged helix-turn-helix domain-containing protein [Salana multivorans]|nr:helix-turn-helix domain-containing protein [Salana multivorans]